MVVDNSEVFGLMSLSPQDSPLVLSHPLSPFHVAELSKF